MGMLHRHRYFGWQMWLVCLSISSTQRLIGTSIVSFKWIFNATVAAVTIIAATLIRVEVMPFAIPLVIQVLVAISERFCDGFTGFITAAVSGALLVGIGLVLRSLVWLIGASQLLSRFGLPKWEWPPDALSPGLLFAEFLTNPHNVAILALAPIAFIFGWVSGVERYWLLAFAGTTIALAFWPITSVIDDVMIRTTLAMYSLILTAGFVMCRGWTGTVGLPLVILVFVASMYFYARPIQM
jgi:hypothetical protein